MKKLLTVISLTMLSSAAALAQTSTAPAPSSPSTLPSTPPAVTAPAAPSTTPPNMPSKPSTGSTTMTDQGMTMTDAQAKSWINKSVYSSDGKKLGEVSELQRDASGKVSELHADIGGFLGLGQTRVRVMPAQFRVENDRIVLNVPSDQAKSLPAIAK